VASASVVAFWICIGSGTARHCLRQGEPAAASDVLTLIHVLGYAARLWARPTPRNYRFFPWALAGVPEEIDEIVEENENADRLLRDWLSGVHRLLTDASRGLCKVTISKVAAGSSVGNLLCYPPKQLDGVPLAPLYKEVQAFCGQRGASA
jgi:hypothetical protein